MTQSTNDNMMINVFSVNNNSVLTGTNVMPMKGQTSSNDNYFSLNRKLSRNVGVYENGSTNNQSELPYYEQYSHNKYKTFHKVNSNNNQVKNNVYQDNSSYLLKKKSAAIGGNGQSQTVSFNSNPTNDVKNALTRMRSSGYVPPKKTN